MRNLIVGINFSLMVIFAQSLEAAAETSSVGTSSQGLIGVNLTVEKLVQLSYLRSQMTIGSFSGSGGKSENQDLVISSNNEEVGSTYSVAITSVDCVGTGFRLIQTSGGAHKIPLTIRWKQGTHSRPASSTVASCSSPLVAQNGMNLSLAETTATANIQLDVAEGDMTAAPSASYSTTLTVTVAPE